MKRLLFFICTLLFANVLLSQTYDYTLVSEGLIYACNNSDPTVSIYGYKNPPTDLVIPSTMPTTYIVTSIADYAFRRTTHVIEDGESFIWVESPCTTLTSVTIPNSVTSIGYAAFYECSSLTSVTIPNSVTSIDDWAFGNCSSLTSVTIPNSITSIEFGVFDSCTNLTSVNIPNSVTSIGEQAFNDCYSLTSVTIPNSVTSIGNRAFKNCSSLTSVNIGNSVTSIGDYAFGWCSSLTSVTIPNSVIIIGVGAFNSCISLTSVTIGNSVTSIGHYAFASCDSLTSVTIPNSVTSIGYGAFSYCSSLTSVNIPNSITSIEEWAFAYCSSLTSVTCLATNPPALGDNAFDYIGSPSTLYVPNGCGEAYENSSWAQYFDCIVELGSGVTSVNLDVEVNNEEWGHVEVDGGCDNATLTAVADNDCSDFWRWSDGDTNNPRVINVSSYTPLIAIFTDPVFDTTIYATIAQGETYSFNGYELSEEGSYSATVLSVNGCEINLTLVLDVIASNNIGADYSSLSQTSLELLSLKPNPTKGLIEFGQRIDKVVVIDISGRRIESFFDANQINISHLPAGVYHLELQCGDETVVRKIVKE